MNDAIDMLLAAKQGRQPVARSPWFIAVLAVGAGACCQYCQLCILLDLFKVVLLHCAAHCVASLLAVVAAATVLLTRRRRQWKITGAPKLDLPGSLTGGSRGVTDGQPDL